MNEPRANGGLPWQGAARRVDLLCWAGIIASGLWSLALLPLVPSLLGTNPVLLAALRGSTSSLITAGAFARVGEASTVWALLAPLPQLMVWGPFYWWAGRLWGTTAIELFTGRSARSQRWAARVRRHAPRWSIPAVVLAYVLPIPSSLIYAAAGWTGMGLATFLLADLAGTLIWVGLLVGLGYEIGQSAVDVAKAISHYGLYATIALIVVVVAVQMRRGSRPQAL
jgi:membrane protein DedA with SNARE-associated domain